MIFTAIGVIQIALGLAILLQGSLRAMFLFLIVSGLFGGSASLIFPVLGGSSVPTVQFALPFVFLRLLMAKGGVPQLLGEAVRGNLWLVAFTIYGIVAAFVGPRIFAGDINVFPMRFEGARGLFDTVPLAPSPQNITASINALGALLVALASYMLCRTWSGVSALVSGAIAIAWLLVFTGLLGLAGKGTFIDVIFGFLRNGSYAQLDQSYQGFLRINGTFPEASGFASFSFAWFVLNFELWYRNIRPRATGAAALALGLVMFFSTSSTAYVGLLSSLLFFVLRMILLPRSAPASKLRAMGAAMLVTVFAVSCTLVLAPQMAESLLDMIRHMTVDKQGSDSGQQRLFWALQGFEAFRVSWGLGIGPGSFRSSSIITAIIGTMGLFGALTFTAYLFAVLKPGRQSTWVPVSDQLQAIGAAASCSALLVIVPAAISSPSSHPGTNFAIFAGAALALRRGAFVPVSSVEGDRARAVTAGA